ncbi:sce7726 family protein [Clostridium perfringens]|uniref:sce7726 family protein n=1 Tax=Clostridium perfringens TaxID=1502 RepID=UPI00210BA27A|nr:sce7726 family protein [Clostridium perfringens]
MDNNIILNRIFTKSTFNEILNNKKSDCYSNVIKTYLENFENKKNKELIKDLYKFMDKKYRNEYYFKNTLINKLLLGKYSLNTTTALTEVPINKSKADFILVNKSKGIVYEIKTGLDTLDRLENQLKDYYKAFTLVNVVISEEKYEKVNKLLENTNIGIYILTKHNTLSLRKRPIEDSSKLEYKTIFNILRKNEFENIILDYYKELPKIQAAFYYDKCFELINQIDINLFYSYMLNQLKKRIIINKRYFLEKIPYELKFLVYFSEYNINDYSNISNFLEKGFEY